VAHSRRCRPLGILVDGSIRGGGGGASERNHGQDGRGAQAVMDGTSHRAVRLEHTAESGNHFSDNSMLNFLESITFMRFDRLGQNAS
jgi:hypothetical protein